jgi:hypothetical protein
MRIEVYYKTGELKEVMTCNGPEVAIQLDGKPCIEPSGRCSGCDFDRDEEEIQCYEEGKRIWFRDPAELGPLFTLEDFLKEAEP